MEQEKIKQARNKQYLVQPNRSVKNHEAYDMLLKQINYGTISPKNDGLNCKGKICDKWECRLACGGIV